MGRPRMGELFAGYGGLGMGVQAVFGGEMAWYSEIDKGALKILTHRFPDVPNIGDITAVDWSQVEPVDILTGGSPCQDLSHAGKRAGMTEGTRSNLWVAMREAIAQLRPRLVIWENVRGAYSAEADSDLVTDPRLLASVRRRDGQPVLRALGRVLGDLSDLGYVGGWHGLRAADIGAPHGRFRVFVVAEDANQSTRGERWLTTPGQAQGGRAWSDAGGRGGDLLPTPRASDGTKGGPNQRGSSGDLMLPSAVALMGTPTARMWKGSGPIGSQSHQWLLDHGNVEAQVLLLPTPAVNDMGEGKTVERWDEWTADMQARHGNGNGHGKSLAIEAQRLLPTPMVGDAASACNSTATRHKIPPTGIHAGDTLTDIIRGAREWGDYAPAIARWEHILGRPAPAPTQTSSKGNPQLSAAFVEWLMGLPDGWVTDVPGITRNEALKALGNGVVPQQAEAAIRWLLARVAVAA